MKKKLYGLLLTLALMAGVLTVRASAATILQSGECGANGNNVTWTLDSDYLLNIRGTGAMRDYASADNLPWYAYREQIKTVTVWRGVTRVGNNAFRTCTALESVELPDSLTSIGNVAFYHCDALSKSGDANFTIPENVTTIGENAFGYCSALTELTIPASVVGVKNKDGEVVIPGIGEGAFFRCTGMTAFTVEDDNTEYSALDGVLFNKDQTTLLWYPIDKNASEYTVPDGVTTIGPYAFHSVKKLTTITVPEGVETIEQRAFSYNELSHLSLPLSLKEIKDYAFYECTNLSNDDGSEKEGSKVDYAGSRQQWPAIILGVGNSRLTNAKIEYKETQQDKIIASGECGDMGSNAMWSVSELKDAEGSYLLTISGTGAVNNYRSVSDTPWKQEELKEEGKELISKIVQISVKEGITRIGDYAFASFGELTEVVELPATLTTIGARAFSDCEKLPKLDLSETGVTSIGSYAFNGCTALTEIVFPDTLTTIGDRAFLRCSALEAVTIPAAVSSIGPWAFRWCASLKTLTMAPLKEGDEAHYTAIGDYAFADCTALTSVSFTENLTVIGDYAFSDCSSLLSVAFPANVSGVGICAFRGCMALTGFSVDEDNVSFYAASGILMNNDQTYIYCYPARRPSNSCAIPFSVNSVAAFAFDDAEELTDVYYAGTKAQWDNIDIGKPNDLLEELANQGNIHYQDAVPTQADKTSIDAITMETTENGKNAVIRVYCARSALSAELWCASYDSDGRFLDVEVSELNAGEDNEVKKALTEEIGELRIFILDGGLPDEDGRGGPKALCSSWTYEPPT